MTKSITELFVNMDDGSHPVDELLPLVYNELRAIAAAQLRQENSGHSLATTDLVHEAYLNLFHGNRSTWNDKKHFFAYAALAMRRILVDHARKKAAKKRVDPDAGIPQLDRVDLGSKLSIADMLDLDRALSKMQTLDEQQSQIVNFKIFAGLTSKETAELMGISERTVARDWWSAKVWLREQMDHER